MNHPSKNPDYPFYCGKARTYEEIVAYYTQRVPEDERDALVLARLISWLSSQPYSPQLQPHGVLGVTLLFLAHDTLCEGPHILLGFGHQTNGIYSVQYYGSFLQYPRRSFGIVCSAEKLQENLETYLKKLLKDK